VIAQPNSQLKKFSFLIGLWSLNTQKGKIIEKWDWDKTTGLSGAGYSISTSGDSTLLETISLHQSGNEVFYTPTGYQEGNRSTVSFKLVSDDKGTFIFENKNHDFPQRIVYRKISENELLAWIEGTVEGKFRKIEFPYKKHVY
jgi:hypothetical protein